MPPRAVTARGVPLRRREPTRTPQTDCDGEDGKLPGASLQSWGKSELARGNDALKTATRRCGEEPRRDFYRLSRRQTVVAHERPAEDSGSLPHVTRPREPPSLRPFRPRRGQTDGSTPLFEGRGLPTPHRRTFATAIHGLRSLDADCASASCLRWSTTPALGAWATPQRAKTAGESLRRSTTRPCWRPDRRPIPATR